jgi:hypothetical protein
MGLLAQYAEQGDQGNVVTFLGPFTPVEATKMINQECAIHQLIIGAYNNNNGSYVETLEFLLTYNPDIYLRDQQGTTIFDLAVGQVILAIDQDKLDLLKTYTSIITVILTKESSLRADFPAKHPTLAYMPDDTKRTPLDMLKNASKWGRDKKAVDEIITLIVQFNPQKKPVDTLPAQGLRHRHPAKLVVSDQRAVKTVPTNTTTESFSSLGTLSNLISYVTTPFFSFWNSAPSTPLNREAIVNKQPIPQNKPNR